MKPMTYKGYVARIEYSDDDECFVGRIAGINDVVGFHGESVAQMRRSFEEAVDDYLATCERLGRAPQQAASGSVLVRMEPELHQAIAARADASGKSMNIWLVENLRALVTSNAAAASKPDAAARAAQPPQGTPKARPAARQRGRKLAEH